MGRYGKNGGGRYWPAGAGRVVVGWGKAEICSVKKKMDGERLLPAGDGGELAGCCGMLA